LGTGLQDHRSAGTAAAMDARHAVRKRRFFMALASYALWSGVTLIAWAAGLIMMPAWVLAGLLGGIVLSNAWFWHLLRSGRSLLYRDPSMTLPQVALALVWALVIVGASRPDRSLMLIVFFVVMLFGIFRLDRADFLKVTALALVGYAVVVAADLLRHDMEIQLVHEFVRFLVLATGMFWCTFFGAHVAQLRSRLRRQNEELQQLIKKAERTAERDHLTRAYNRRYIMKELENERARSARRHAPFSIVIFDLDHFKLINDRHGHAVGDRVLTRFSEIACRELRAVDVVSPGRRRNAFGRFGGEEFIALLPETGLEGARRCTDRLQAAVAAERFDGGVRVTFSAGISVYRHDETVEQTLARADDALYRAKRAGRDKIFEEKPVQRSGQSAKVVRLKPGDH
jgi:diguanylate cyclase